MISLHEPEITEKDQKTVLKSLRSGWVSISGKSKFVKKFEDKISKFCKVKYVLATNSGTSSLFLALKIAGVKKNYEVIVPTITFIAPINAVAYNGAVPIFMDSDDSLNIDQDKTIKFLEKFTYIRDGFTYNIKTKKKIAAIVFVHTFGNLCKIDKLLTECKKRNIITIEDAAESLGAYYNKGKFKNKYAGTLADIGCYSFNGNKIITTGAGGALVTNSKKFYTLASYLSSQAKDDPLNYIHNSIGYNLKMPNLSAALGCSQMGKILIKIKKKKNIFILYKKYLDSLSFINFIEPPNYSNSNYWLILIVIDFDKEKKNKLNFVNYLYRKNIEVRPLWRSNHLQKPYKNCQNFNIENSTFFLKNTICLPSSSHLSANKIQYICDTIRLYFNKP